jgi:hypothetical protein
MLLNVEQKIKYSNTGHPKNILLRNYGFNFYDEHISQSGWLGC